MPRELWKGAIHFGLVHIPVSLYPAEESNELSFTMLDRRDLQPVGYKRYNKSTGDEVPFDQIVKGYEYDEGRFVTLEKEDFRRANVEASQTVDIIGFVDAKDIPPYYFESPYYLAPGQHGEKGYALLREGGDPHAPASRGALSARLPAGPQHAALPQRIARCRRHQGACRPQGREGEAQRAQHGRAADRGHGDEVEAGRIPRHLSRRPAQDDRGEGRRQAQGGAEEAGAARGADHRLRLAPREEPQRPKTPCERPGTRAAPR